MIAEPISHKNAPPSSALDFDEEIFMTKGARTRMCRMPSRGRRQTSADFDSEDEDGSYGGVDARRDSSDRLEELDPSLLTDEERAYRNARRRAEKKVALTRAAWRAALITVPLLVFIPFAGVIAFLYFGVGLGRRAFRLFYEPQLRERFLQEEVQRQVVTRVRSERQHLEGEHHRSLEQLSASIAHEIRNPITAAKS